MKVWEIFSLKISVPDILHDPILFCAGKLTNGKASYSLSISTGDKTLPFQGGSEKKMRWGRICSSEKKDTFHLLLEKDHYIPAVLSDFLVYLLKNITTQAFLFHSASFVYNKNAYLVPGRADRGKTTLTQHFPEEYVLDDELCAVYRSSKNGFSLISLPPIPPEDENYPYKWRGPYPLKKMIFLRRCGKSKNGILSAEDSLSFLEDEGPFFYLPEQQTNFMKFCEELTRIVTAGKFSYFIGDSQIPDKIFF